MSPVLGKKLYASTPDAPSSVRPLIRMSPRTPAEPAEPNRAAPSSQSFPPTVTRVYDVPVSADQRSNAAWNCAIQSARLPPNFESICANRLLGAEVVVIPDSAGMVVPSGTKLHV